MSKGEPSRLRPVSPNAKYDPDVHAELLQDHAVMAQKDARPGLHRYHSTSDRAWAEAQKKKNEARRRSVEAKHRSSVQRMLGTEETEAALRRALFDKLQALDEADGHVFSHHFQAKRLGFSLQLARFGDAGRHFLRVEATQPTCELYPQARGPRGTSRMTPGAVAAAGSRRRRDRGGGIGAAAGSRRRRGRGGGGVAATRDRRRRRGPSKNRRHRF